MRFPHFIYSLNFNYLYQETIKLWKPFQMDELTRRKARRVSIVCGSGQGGQQDDHVTTPVTTVPMATSSCVDLSTVLTHPAIKAFKMSHSTPNSPHSSRRRTNSNSMSAPPGIPVSSGHPEVGATASAPPSTTHHHHHRKEGSDPVPMTATVSRTKCSRRHSEGTVHTVHRNSAASGGAGFRRNRSAAQQEPPVQDSRLGGCQKSHLSLIAVAVNQIPGRGSRCTGWGGGRGR